MIVLNASFSFAQELHAERATDGSVELDLPPLTGESQPVTRYVPPLQAVFHAAALSATDVAVLAGFAVIVLAADEVRRWWMRRGHRSR